MFLLKSKIISLIATCATADLPIDYMQAIISVESNYNQYALAVGNSSNGTGYLPNNKTDAGNIITLAKKKYKQGDNIAIGLGQISTWNIKHRNLDIGKLFSNSCFNIEVASTIFKEGLNRTCKNGKFTSNCVEQALRIYNTGSTKLSIAGLDYVNSINLALDDIRKKISSNTSKFVVIESGSEDLLFYIEKGKISNNAKRVIFRGKIK